MKNHVIKEGWIPDEVTYNKIQELLKFVDFVAHLEFSNNNDKSIAEEIRYQIQNINQPEVRKRWSICLDIFDPGIQNGNGNEGIFWRSWSIFFETDYIDIIAESLHTSSDGEHYGNDFHYIDSIYMGAIPDLQTVYMDNGIPEFIKDAMEYKKYLSETLNDIQVDFYFEGHR